MCVSLRVFIGAIVLINDIYSTLNFYLKADKEQKSRLVLGFIIYEWVSFIPRYL